MRREGNQVGEEGEPGPEDQPEHLTWASRKVRRLAAYLVTYLQGRHKLNGADQGKGSSWGKGEANRIQEVGSIYPDVHKDIQYPEVSVRGVHGNWEETRIQETVLEGQRCRGPAWAKVSEQPGPVASA